MSREYIIQQYKLAVSDFQLAHDDEVKHDCLRTMRRLKELAARLYGFQFADSLR